jgi:hypothetical protein
MSAAIDLVSFVSRRPLPVTNRRKVIVAANHIRDRLNVRCWHQADLAAWLPMSAFSGKSRNLMLAPSFSGYDPDRTPTGLAGSVAVPLTRRPRHGTDCGLLFGGT